MHMSKTGARKNMHHKRRLLLLQLLLVSPDTMIKHIPMPLTAAVFRSSSPGIGQPFSMVITSGKPDPAAMGVLYLQAVTRNKPIQVQEA
jgi:hypothetical protein